MGIVTGPFKMQIASDAIRDGIGVELLAGNEIVAEAFRCDADKTLIVTTFGNDVPLVAIEALISQLRKEFQAFEDGTPLPNNCGPLA